MVEKNRLSPWKGVVSGTTAAILANVLVYPLDIVKTRLQVQIQQQKTNHVNDKHDHDRTQDPQYTGAADAIRKILRQDGISGLYTGIESSIAGTASMNFAYFYWSAAARSAYQQGLQYCGIEDFNTIIKEFGLGAAGGALAQLCTTPIAVIATRQQTRKADDEKQSMWEAMMDIVSSEDGWTGLWRGLKVNLILVINPMITYGVYQWLRVGLVGLKKQFGSLDAFCSFFIPPSKSSSSLIISD
ncbi:ADP/ATP carrier protein [Penicillium ochrochloron]